MPRRRDLNGIAGSVLGSFISRYNNIDGYWAMGQLYKFASDNNQQTIKFELLPHSSQKISAIIQQISTKYRSFLHKKCLAISMPESRVQKCTISVRFNIPETELPKFWPGTNGEPFEVTVEILDDINRIRSATTLGRCYRHDPKREQQSVRVEETPRLLFKISKFLREFPGRTC